MGRLKSLGNVYNIPDKYIKMSFLNNYDYTQELNLFIQTLKNVDNLDTTDIITRIEKE